MLPVAYNVSSELGITFPSYFGSEFGASVMSSFESMSPTLAPEHWSLHGGAAADNCDAHDVTNGFWRDCTSHFWPMAAVRTHFSVNAHQQREAFSPWGGWPLKYGVAQHCWTPVFV
jgi:hypothetical protein